MSSKRKKAEDAQRAELVKYHKVKLKPQYPNLILIVIPNNGFYSIITEVSHPDLLWSYHARGGEKYWLYHELKKSDGALDKKQKQWWSEFEETKYCKGIITKGWEEHLKGLHDWLSSLPIV